MKSTLKCGNFYLRKVLIFSSLFLHSRELWKALIINSLRETHLHKKHKGKIMVQKTLRIELLHLYALIEQSSPNPKFHE